MALFPSIMELFGSKPAPAPMSPEQQRVANMQGQSQGTGNTDPAGNSTVPNSTTPASDGKGPAAFPVAGKGEASPLENYKDVWQVPSSAPTPEMMVPTITFDPTKAMEAANKFDFTKGIDPEMLTKAASGDAAALAGVINQSSRAAYAQGAAATVAITKDALSQQANNFATKYAPAMLRSDNIRAEVNKNSALSSDPAAGPVIAALTSQLSSKFPTATSEEINKHVQNYLQDFASRIVTESGGQISTKAELERANKNILTRPEMDWDAWATMDETR